MCLLGMFLLTSIQSLQICKMHVKHVTTFLMCDVISWSTMILCPTHAWVNGFSTIWTNATWKNETTFMGVFSTYTNVDLLKMVGVTFSPWTKIMPWYQPLDIRVIMYVYPSNGLYLLFFLVLFVFLEGSKLVFLCPLHLFSAWVIPFFQRGHTFTLNQLLNL